MSMIRYRTEAFSGTGERDAARVMAFETFELQNTDILLYLAEGILKDTKLQQKCCNMPGSWTTGNLICVLEKKVSISSPKH